jgi:hypothetical protein
VWAVPRLYNEDQLPPPSFGFPATASHNSNSQLSRNLSQSHIAADGQSITKSRCRASSGALTVTVLFLWAPSLTRGLAILLYMLLALGSVVFLESESLWTRDHILLSQI